MATLALVIGIAALLLSSGFAQPTESSEIVWSSVAYVLYGDRTPLRDNVTDSPALTPLGAQQLYQQGSLFRARYLSPDATLARSTASITGQAPIHGIETNAIDNSQLWVASSTDEYTAGSAYAFMQGLYPPRNRTYSDSIAGLDGAVVASRTLLDYPLNGYQYPNVQTLSVLDPGSVWIEGNVGCGTYEKSILDSATDAVNRDNYNKSFQWYQEMWANVFAGVFTLPMTNFRYAYELYDYAQYRWAHDSKFRDLITAGDLALLRKMAYLQQSNLNGNLSASGASEGDMIRAVAGRTLAAKVVAQMKASIGTGGYGYKMNLMFGSFEPFLAFFALSDLTNGPSAATFTDLPSPGAAMMFELYSIGQNGSAYPADEDLWVRFLYRNGTDSGAKFIEYPLFGNGNSQAAMRWSDFQNQVQRISVDTVAKWCRTCDGITMFCPVLAEGGSAGSTRKGSRELSPAVAGVIGAIVAISVMGLAVMIAAVLGGLRVYRADQTRRNSTLGGFKGAEKMTSDPDLAVAKGGARHERTGSWELRDGDPKSDVTATVGAVVNKSQSPALPKDDRDEDAISELNATAVKPREEV